MFLDKMYPAGNQRYFSRDNNPNNEHREMIPRNRAIVPRFPGNVVERMRHSLARGADPVVHDFPMVEYPASVRFPNAIRPMAPFCFQQQNCSSQIPFVAKSNILPIANIPKNHNSPENNGVKPKRSFTDCDSAASDDGDGDGNGNKNTAPAKKIKYETRREEKEANYKKNKNRNNHKSRGNYYFKRDPAYRQYLMETRKRKFI